MSTTNSSPSERSGPAAAAAAAATSSSAAAGPAARGTPSPAPGQPVHASTTAAQLEGPGEERRLDGTGPPPAPGSIILIESLLPPELLAHSGQHGLGHVWGRDWRPVNAVAIRDGSMVGMLPSSSTGGSGNAHGGGGVSMETAQANFAAWFEEARAAQAAAGAAQGPSSSDANGGGGSGGMSMEALLAKADAYFEEAEQRERERQAQAQAGGAGPQPGGQ